MRKIGKKKLIVGGIAAAVIAAGAGTALAYWTTSGSGTGSASTGTSHAVTIDQVGTITNLTPGSPAQAVDFKITNPDTTNQFISSVVVSYTVTPATGNTCDADNFTLVQPNAINADLTPGAHTYAPSGASLALKNLPTNQDGCKGATVNLAFNAS